jgi:hypothetical protein
LIPHPSLVCIALARNVREASLLQSLLRISPKAAEDRRFIEASRQADCKPNGKRAHG